MKYNEIDIVDIGLGRRNEPQLNLRRTIDEVQQSVYSNRECSFRGTGPECSFTGTLVEDNNGYKQMGLWLAVSGKHLFVEVLDNNSGASEYTGEAGHGNPDFEIRIKNLDKVKKVIGFVGVRYYGSDKSWRFWDYSYLLGDDTSDIGMLLDRQEELERQGDQNRLLTPEDERMVRQIFAGRIEGELPNYMGQEVMSQPTEALPELS